MSKNFELMNTSRQSPVISTLAPIGMTRTYGSNKEMRLRDVWDSLVRRKRIVFGTLLACLLVVGLVCAFGTRYYKATGQIQVGKETENNLGLQTDGSPEAPPDAIQENLTLQTQASILESDTLALKVINDLNLESTEDFRPSFNPIGYVLGLFTIDGPPDPHKATLEESPRRRVKALKVFSKRLKVQPVSGTRLIEISYLNPDPKLAAQIVNHLANSLVDYNFKIKHDATSHTAEWLAGQMSDLRKQSEDLQAKVAQLQHESGVFSLGETDATGREEVYSGVLDKLQQSTTALTQAQANRIGKTAIYQVAQSGNPEAISQLSGNSVFASSSGLDASLSLIQSMRMQEATLRGEVGELSAKFGPEYPKLAEMQSHLNALDDSIHAEVKRISDRAKNDYDVATQVEDEARKAYMKQKHQADLVNDKTIEYIIARKEADESRNLYESLFRQLKQSGVLAGFRASNISLVDPARIPARPARPNPLLYLAAATAGGLFFGVAAALIKDGIDTRVQDLVAFEYELGLVPLGIIPYYKMTRSRFAGIRNPRSLANGARSQTMNQSNPRIVQKEEENQRTSRIRAQSGDGNLSRLALEEPHSAFVEALRALRTSLLFSKVRIPPKVILFTSSISGEGKSTLSANLAIILADQQKRVLLVDADLRHPGLHNSLNVSSDTGLSWLLEGKSVEQTGQSFETAALSVAVPAEGVPQLYVVPSGAFRNTRRSCCPRTACAKRLMSGAVILITSLLTPLQFFR